MKKILLIILLHSFLYGQYANKAIVMSSSGSIKSIQGLVLWMDASTVEGITKNVNNKVTAWRDKSSNSYLMVQSDTSLGPVFVNNVVAGKSAVRLDGVDDCIEVTTPAVTTYPYEVFAVAKKTLSAPTGGTILSIQNTVDNTQYSAMRVADTALLVFDRNTAAEVLASKTHTDNTWNIYNAQHASVSSRTAVVNKVSGTENTSSMTAFTPNASTIGRARNSGPVFLFGGDIAEIIVFKRIINSSERSKVYRYLKTKYSLQ